MKDILNFFAGKGRMGSWVSMLLLLQLAGNADAQVTLTDGNSVARIDPTSQSGMYQWALQGQNELYQQWFWFRTGNTLQRSIDTISAPNVTTIGTREMTTTYTANNFTLSIDYLLTGGSLVGAGGTAVSDIGETIRIINTSAAALDFHFFQYSDFDLGGIGSTSDSVSLGRNLRGQFNDAYQTHPGVALTETVTTPGADHGEVDYYSNTRTRLNTIAGYNLNDTPTAVGPGDVTWALQWDLNIAPGGSAIISKDKYLSVVITPEPTALALGGLGVVLWALRRRTAK